MRRMELMGIIRKIDDLGRITLPIELRRRLEYKERQELEMFVEGDEIWLRKCEPRCCFCDSTEKLYIFHEKLVCGACITQLGGMPKSHQIKKVGKTVNLEDVK